MKSRKLGRKKFYVNSRKVYRLKPVKNRSIPGNWRPANLFRRFRLSTNRRSSAFSNPDPSRRNSSNDNRIQVSFGGFTFLFVRLSVHPIVHLTVRLTVCLYICLSICPSICPSIFPYDCTSVQVCFWSKFPIPSLSFYPSVCLSVCLSVCPSVQLSACLFVHLSARLSVHISIWLSVRPFVRRFT